MGGGGFSCEKPSEILNNSHEKMCIFYREDKKTTNLH